jgi:hypothetical protein
MCPVVTFRGPVLPAVQSPPYDPSAPAAPINVPASPRWVPLPGRLSTPPAPRLDSITGYIPVPFLPVPVTEFSVFFLKCAYPGNCIYCKKPFLQFLQCHGETLFVILISQDIHPLFHLIQMIKVFGPAAGGHSLNVKVLIIFKHTQAAHNLVTVRQLAPTGPPYCMTGERSFQIAFFYSAQYRLSCGYISSGY